MSWGRGWYLVGMVMGEGKSEIRVGVLSIWEIVGVEGKGEVAGSGT